MDSEGLTPLHIACRGGASSTMIELLVHYGSHLDTKEESIIRLLTLRSNVHHLKCLCARVIAKDDLKRSLMELLPSDLTEFVVLHDANRT
jgi:ankyrin repeat protein